MNQHRAKPRLTLESIVKKSDAQHRENSERLISIAHEMASIAEKMGAHIHADAAAFAAQNAAILEVNKDVKSLLASRSFLRGTWFAIVTVGTLVGVIVPIVLSWWPMFRAWLKP